MLTILTGDRRNSKPLGKGSGLPSIFRLAREGIVAVDVDDGVPVACVLIGLYRRLVGPVDRLVHVPQERDVHGGIGYRCVDG